MARYTPEQKQEAVALCLEIGMAAAHERNGIPKATMSNWLTEDQRTEMAQRFATKTAAATQAARLTWEQRRATVCLNLADLVELGITKAHGYLQDDKPDKARSCMTPVGVGIDKLLVLHGQANTIHSMSFDPEPIITQAKADGDRLRPLRAV